MLSAPDSLERLRGEISTLGGSMNTLPTLRGKRAVVFGAGGSIGAAVAREFAAEGAEVFLSGRTRPTVEDVRRQIESAGGPDHAAGVDGLYASSVGVYVGS